ncbi:MAG: DUF1848 family protein, partial [Bacteroidales bacterium]|nr:DUF1848 family protein [Bacteroidales bacterium]
KTKATATASSIRRNCSSGTHRNMDLRTSKSFPMTDIRASASTAPAFRSFSVWLTRARLASSSRRICPDNRDKGQRTACGCMVSKDIGEYNTCPHLCEYCYANASKEVAVKNYEQAKLTDWKSETITGK